MVKRKVLIILIVLAFTLGSFTGVFSQGLAESIRVFRNYVTIFVNDEKVQVDNFLYNGTTYVPLRSISEILEKEVGWNQYTKEVTINDPYYDLDNLSKLLPDEEGYTWNYFGFAEYGHTMTLNSITDTSAMRTYTLSGEVMDMSDGESGFDFSIDLKYIIKGNSLMQEVDSQVMLDNEIPKITLIKSPLVPGNYWNQNVQKKNGETITLSSMITQVSLRENNVKEYTVIYEDFSSPYYEKRIIREGVGVVSFEKLMTLGGDSFPIGYQLYNVSDIDQTTVSLYFSDSNAEKVVKETRTIDVYNKEFAYYTLLELIKGPFSENLYKTIPEDTRILNLILTDGILTIDFSKEFIENHWGGAAGESMTLNSLAATMTQFETVDGIKILVEGEGDVIIEHVLLDGIIYPDPNMIQN